MNGRRNRMTMKCTEILLNCSVWFDSTAKDQFEFLVIRSMNFSSCELAGGHVQRTVTAPDDMFGFYLLKRNHDLYCAVSLVMCSVLTCDIDVFACVRVCWNDLRNSIMRWTSIAAILRIFLVLFNKIYSTIRSVIGNDFSLATCCAKSRWFSTKFDLIWLEIWIQNLHFFTWFKHVKIGRWNLQFISY